jgi:hypothetical protein
MKPILSPVKLRESSDNVANLQAALNRLLPTLGFQDFKISDGEALRRFVGETTARGIGILQDRFQIRPSAEVLVDAPMADLINRLLKENGLLDEEPADPATQSNRVSGIVRDVTGEPVAGLTVRAFDREIRPPHQPLGSAVTDQTGFYEIGYADIQYADGDDLARRGADLFLEVWPNAGLGRRSLLTTVDEYVRNAPSSYQWNLTLSVPAGLSEFERLVRRLQPVLRNLTFAELEETAQNRDVTFLIGETGLDRSVIETLLVAFRLEARTRLFPECWYGLLTEKALARPEIEALNEQTTQVLASLPSLDFDRAAAALKRAFSANRIPQNRANEIDRWLAMLRDVARQQLVDEGQPRAEAFRISLDLARLPDDRQTVFLDAYLGQTGLTDEFLQKLQTEHGFKPAEIENIRASFTLSRLTDHNPVLLRTLASQIERNGPLGVQMLAKRSPGEWANLVANQTVPDYLVGDSSEQKRENYARQLAGRFARTYPTTAFLGDLERDERPALPEAPSLLRFLDAHPDFELLNTPVDEFLQNRLKPELKPLLKNAAFVQDLKITQRVFKLAPDYAATRALLAGNVHSARQVYERGQAAFVKTYGDQPGFSAEAARQTYQRAAQTYATTLTLAGHLISLKNAGDLGAVQLAPVEAVQAANAPSLPNLFGAADVCECDHCRSVYGPAAYFADILNYLKGRPSSAGTAKDVLFARRPDLGFIELTCENALTPLPYVDVVSEVLENQIAPEYRLMMLSAGAGATLPAVPSPVSGPVRSEFFNFVKPDGQPLRVTLSDDAFVDSPGPTGYWLLRDTAATYLIRPEGGAFGVVEVPQTLQSADELAAIPRYLNPLAYEKLRKAVYPLSLPFDLFNEEIRRYASQAGTSRWELMDVFSGSAAPNNPKPLDIAAEFLGFSADELKLMATKKTAGQAKFWGETTNPVALNKLAQVDVFLTKTGLEYTDLQRLLTLLFLNPDGNLRIIHEDPSCDTVKKHLETLTVEHLDRFHRFLRLWRKLGWEAWQVDLLLLHPKIGQISLVDLQADPTTADVDFEKLLLALKPFRQLLNRFPRATVEQLVGLLGDLPTADAFTQAFKPATPSLFNRVFQNKKVTNPIDPDLAPAAMTANPSRKLADKKAVVSAALRIKEGDFDALRVLFDPVLPADVTLSLPNLSRLYANVMLAKWLGVKPVDWVRWRKLIPFDPFASPDNTLRWLDAFDVLRTAGISPDELDYVLNLDLTSKAAVAEKTVTVFLTGLRDELKKIALDTDAAQLTTDDGAKNAAILSTQLTALGWSGDAITGLVDVLTNQRTFALKVTPGAGFEFPDSVPHPSDPNATLPVSYDASNQRLSYTGLMTTAEQAALLAQSADAGYQTAVNDLFQQQRDFLSENLRLFQTPVFVATLRQLPADVAFADQLTDPLRTRIRFDTERRMLFFSGKLDAPELATLLGLSAEGSFQTAVNELKTASDAFFAAPPADEIWASAGDLATWFDTPAQYAPIAVLNDLTTRVLAYLRPRRQRETVITLVANQFGLTEATTELLLNSLALFAPDTLLDSFAGDAFASDADRSGTYHWLARLAWVLRKTGASYAETDWLLRNAAGTGTLDLTAPALAKPIATSEHLNRLLAYFDWHRHFVSDALTWLDVTEKLLTDPAYTPALFATDLQTLTEWPASETEAFTAGTSPVFPADYCEPATWQRLKRAFGILENLSASVSSVWPLAAPVVGVTEAQRIKQLLKAAYEPEQWLDVCKTIQDGLREGKRDALTAYLLTQPAPADVPTGKWENTNDLFAYYLLDVEMCSCMITSRLVQASGSVQLFVQRCLMGLEPQVRANADDDPAWKQWQWMQAYRVWEANRKVFLYPENWIQPELRRDKSPFFKELEDELLQGDITRDNVETAFLHYIEKLDGVAQLDVAGMYYEEKTNTLHVVGRTPGAEPHLYYYRKWVDDAYWTPWTKIEADIKSDYLVPLVMNERLYLLWPEFREEAQPVNTMNIPSQGDTGVTIPEPNKRLRVFLALSELRNGKWSPKKVSKDSVTTSYTDPETLSDHRTRFVFVPLDMTAFPGLGTFVVFVAPTDSGGQYFELLGCKGYPEKYEGPIGYAPLLPHFDRDNGIYTFLKSFEKDPGDPLTLQVLGMNADILGLTPGRFNNKLALQPSAFDYFFFLLWLLKIIQDGGKAFLRGHINLIPITLGTWLPWFYADRERTFFVRPEALFWGQGDFKVPELKKVLFYKDFKDWFARVLVALITQDIEGLKKIVEEYGAFLPETKLLFQNFYHPFSCLFARELLNRGVDGLMNRKTQLADKKLDFKTMYQPMFIVDPKYPQEVVDFSAEGSYSSYNWELFYHAPLLIAQRLSTNQQFEEATRWFHYIFDPTGAHDTDPRTGLAVGSPQKFWITKPFFERQSADYEQQRIDNIMRMLADDPGVPGYDPLWRQQLENAVALWRKNPFDPHLIAQFRTVAYQKTVVMKYLDNLIAWGDQQFRQDSMESVNRATQLYVLAAEILGPRPRRVPPAQRPPSLTFNELEPHFDDFSNALVELENFVPPQSGEVDDADVPPLPHLLLYFCIPQNDQLLGYWDTVADRLYKIRHCLNIEGVARQLSLFAPPIDPAALVRAAAAGLDIGAALGDLSAPLPLYRFPVLLQKANEVCADLKSLGGAVLSTLEKRDAESLALLRQDHELRLLQLVRDVRQQQIDEAKQALQGLQKYKELVEFRRDYYNDKDFMNAPEGVALGLSGLSVIAHTAGTIADVLAGVMFIIPDFQIGASGFGGSPHVSAKTGGSHAGKATERGANGLYNVATILDKSAAMVSTLASYQRRKEDWDFQKDTSDRELKQLEHQIAGAEIRVALAEKELYNQERQIEQSKHLGDFMKTKYTNVELYGYLLTQTSQAFFQSYQLAHDLAKKAEKCFQFELGVENSSYIQFGYWDSLRKGLLSGERLQVDLRRLEKAYFEQNRRELELTKHISLALVAPAALLQLRQSGRCLVSLPEALFDLDYQGHYFRRIKTVSLSIPCVAGPYTTISCTLRLLRNTVRVTNALNAGQYDHNNEDGVWTDDLRFRDSFTPVKALATSSAQNDAGLFELNFRDERYLPFEGAGVISTWSLELTESKELRQFDYDTISDVLLHLRYTAREDAGLFKQKTVESLKNTLQQAGSELPLRRLFNLKHEFPTEWYRFLHPAAGQDQVLDFDLRGRFPLLAELAAGPKIYRVELLADADLPQLKSFTITYAPGDDEVGLALKPFNPYGGLLRSVREYDGAEKLPGVWKLTFTPQAGQPALSEAELSNLFLLVTYTI